MARVVYCKGCRGTLPNYKEVGQAIKERVRLVSFAKAGEVVLTPSSFGLLGREMTIAPDYKCVMSFPQAWKAHSGSRHDALNVAQFPCPNCGRYVRWIKRAHEMGSIANLFRRW